MKPHGMNIGFTYEVFDKKNEELIPVYSKENLSKLEAYINIKGNDKEYELPMRSFLTNFINTLQGLFAGDGGVDTKKSTASVAQSVSISKRIGMLIGHGDTAVNLSDTGLNIPATHASIIYGNTTFTDPYVVKSEGIIPDVTSALTVGGNKLGFEMRRIFTNNKYSDIILKELVIKNRRVSSSIASNVAGVAISRDLLSEDGTSVGTGITVPYESAIQFLFKFLVYQEANGNGGAVLNLLRLINNLIFKGDQNDVPLIDTSNNTMNITYATNATCGATGKFTVTSAIADNDYGIIVGRYDDRYTGQKSENPSISGDETTFGVGASSLTKTATTVSAVTNPFTKTAQFTVTRDFTNGLTSSVSFNRVGLKIKEGAFVAINRLGSENSSFVLQPNQVFRGTYTFSIKA